MPVTLNEPLSALQRLCEELEYSELLDKAAAARDSQLERMTWVAAFAISIYGSCQVIFFISEVGFLVLHQSITYRLELATNPSTLCLERRSSASEKIEVFDMLQSR